MVSGFYCRQGSEYRGGVSKEKIEKLSVCNWQRKVDIISII